MTEPIGAASSPGHAGEATRTLRETGQVTTTPVEVLCLAVRAGASVAHWRIADGRNDGAFAVVELRVSPQQSRTLEFPGGLPVQDLRLMRLHGVGSTATVTVRPSGT